MGSLKWSIISFDSVVCQHFDIDTLKSLYELAEKQVPMKVKYDKFSDHSCPKCKSNEQKCGDSFCWKCGQALDWNSNE